MAVLSATVVLVHIKTENGEKLSTKKMKYLIPSDSGRPRKSALHLWNSVVFTGNVLTATESRIILSF